MSLWSLCRSVLKTPFPEIRDKEFPWVHFSLLLGDNSGSFFNRVSITSLISLFNYQP